MYNYINTIDFGKVPIRKTFTDGEIIGSVELSGGDNAEIRKDPRTNQPFAVLFDENWNQK